MPDDEYAKLTTITVADKYGKIYTYTRDNNSDTFKSGMPVDITGITAQDGVYNGSPQIGYTGTPTNEQGYTGKYESTYYLSTGEKTTPENSGAEGEGKAPVYAGQYKVKVSVSDANDYYFGFIEENFTIEKAVPTIIEPPTLSGVRGTRVENMEFSGGLVKLGDVELQGTWKVVDSDGTDIPSVGTTNSYKVQFTPNDARNIDSVTTKVVPKVSRKRAVSLADTPNANEYLEDDKNNSETTKDYEQRLQTITNKVKEKIADCITKDPEFQKDLKDRYIKGELINKETKDKIIDELSSDPEFKQFVGEQIKKSALIQDSETRNKLQQIIIVDITVMDKTIDNITNSEFIEDDEVRDKLLSFVRG